MNETESVHPLKKVSRRPRVVSRVSGARTLIVQARGRLPWGCLIISTSLSQMRSTEKTSVSAHVAWITDHARTCYFNLDIDVEHDRKEGMVEGRTRVDLIDPRSV